jgi:hypothetical protein
MSAEVQRYRWWWTVLTVVAFGVTIWAVFTDRDLVTTFGWSLAAAALGTLSVIAWSARMVSHE